MAPSYSMIIGGGELEAKGYLNHQFGFVIRIETDPTISIVR